MDTSRPFSPAEVERRIIEIANANRSQVLYMTAKWDTLSEEEKRRSVDLVVAKIREKQKNGAGDADLPHAHPEG